MTHKHMTVAGRRIGPGEPAYIIAELSANHAHQFDVAVKTLEMAKESGADAVKLQTYTADTMTIDCQNEHFKIKGTLWQDRYLYELYQEAYTPWDWQPQLKKVADELGIHLFSTPFDASAVDFLEKLDLPVYKIASFENVDLPLMRRIAKTGKPVIMSTGMATLAEIDEAVTTLRDSGVDELALLKCTSAYPASPDSMNLRTIPHLAEAFDVVAGLSDHTLGTAVPVAAVALGATIIEKHVTLSRDLGGPDAAFSLEPHELKQLVEDVRFAERALGSVQYGVCAEEAQSRIFRRSLFVVADVAAGERFTAENVRAIRPGTGLHTRHLEEVVGRTASRPIPRGTPLAWDLVG